MPRFARALRSRPFALLWVGQTISILGDGAFFVALVWQVLLSTNSATSISLVEVAQTLPGLLFLLLGGVAADRFPRRLILFCSDSGRAVVVFLLAGLGWFHLLQLWHFVVLALIFGVVDGFFWPAAGAFAPQLVAPDDFPSVNGLTTLSQRLSLVAGPLLGTILIAWAGPEAAFAFDGLTFLVSALCLFAIRLPTPSVEASPSEETLRQRPFQAVKTVLQEMLEGFHFVKSERWLWISIVLGGISNLGLAASVGAAEPKLVRDVYGTGVWLLGVLGATTSVGVILATLVVGQGPNLRRRGVLAYLGMILLGISLTIYGLPLARSHPAVVASLASMTYGFGMGFSGLLWTTLIQERVPEEKLGRVSSIQMLCTLSLIPVGLVVGGVMADRVGASIIFIVCGVLNVILGGVALAFQDIRKLE
jgi:MFS family permease